MKFLHFAALALAIACAPAAHALDGKLIHVKIATKNVPGPVDVARHGGPNPLITDVLLPWADRGRPVPPPGGRPEQARGDEGRCG